MYYIWQVQHEGREIMKIIHHLKNFDPQVMLQYLKLKRTIFWLTEKWLSSYYLSSPTQIFGIILLDLIKKNIKLLLLALMIMFENTATGSCTVPIQTARIQTARYKPPEEWTHWNLQNIVLDIEKYGYKSFKKWIPKQKRNMWFIIYSIL